MRTLSFILGLFALTACVAVPLRGLDSQMPFSAHMMRHTAILLMAAPLLALAIPRDRILRKPLFALSGMAARLPTAAWLCGILVMWIWHVPGWYNSVAGYRSGLISCSSTGTTSLTASCAIPILHELSLLVAGFLFCWPIVTPYREFRLAPLHGVLYLASACVCCSLLGLLITFAPLGTYRGISITDQQTGGMIMWVPCCFVYLSASMFLVVKWLTGKEAVKPATI